MATASDDREPPLLRAALAYVGRGWRVMPLHSPTKSGGCSCGHADCDSIGKHPRTRHGLKDATNREAVVRAWWEKWPTANIGVVTGRGSGLVVIDLDLLAGGLDSWVTLLARYQASEPVTLRVSTGGGGAHLLFAHPGGDRILRNAHQLDGLAGIDVRGDGGYVVAAPSMHTSGMRYSWDNWDSAPASCPDWLLALLDREVKADSAPLPTRQPPAGPHVEDGGHYWLEKYLAQATEGTRNETGKLLCLQLRDDGLAQSQAESVMREYAQRVPGKGYSEREALATLRSIYSRPPRQPARSREYRDRQPLQMPTRNMPKTIPAQESYRDGALARRLDHEDPSRDDETQEKLPRFRFMTDEEVENLPPPEWLISTYLPAGRLSVVYGEYGSCKSFLTLDWALCVATGTPWMGCEVKQGVVAYVAGEGIGGMGKRLRAWKQQRGWQGSSQLYLLGDPPQLLENGDLIALAKALHALPEPPLLVVIDTLARSMVGGDENSAQDMGIAINAAEYIRAEFDAHVALVHHKPAGAQKTRGSTALPGAADTLIAVSKDGETVTVACEKQKDAAPFDKRYLHTEVIALDAYAAPETSLVLVPGMPPAKHDTLPRPAAELLALIAERAGSWSDLRGRFVDRTGQSERTFSRALDLLYDAGLIENTNGDWRVSEC